MRCESIDIQARIPVPINSDGTGICKTPCFKDANGVVYEIEAVKSACEEAKGLPIVRYNDDGNAVVIGAAKSIRYRDGYIEVDGTLFGGGTSEEVVLSSTSDVVEMNIEHIGLGV